MPVPSTPCHRATKTVYGYDANGSQTSVVNTSKSQSDTFEYDVRNKLIKTTVNGTVAQITYDDAGNRVKEVVGSTITYYLTDTQNPTGYVQPLEVHNGTVTGSPATTYFLGDHILGQQGATGGPQYFQTDGHGSTEQLTDANGAVVKTFTYDAFGGAIGFDPTTAGTTILFAGDAIFDPWSGLYLHGDGTRARSGFRFIQDDSPGNSSNDNPISLHKYLYANADPINGSDPTGHFDLISLLLVAGGRFSFEAANFATRYAPAIASATTIAGAVFLVSSVELALEQNGFLPQNNYTPYVVAVSGLIFTAGQSLQAIGRQTALITSPLRNSDNGKIISGDAANAAAGTPLPPYAPASLAAEGTIAPGTQLVRFYAPGTSGMVGQFCVEQSEVEGLTAAEIQAKLALPALPTRVVDVDAAGQAARTGIVGPNFGQPGGGPQVQLLPPYGAKFVNDRPLPPGGL